MKVSEKKILRVWFSPIIILLISVMSFSCEKDNLVDELEVFKGKYTWNYTKYRKNWWSNTYITKPATKWDYTAEVEFNTKGQLVFFINGKEIHKTGFKVIEKYISNEGATISMEIDPSKEDSKELDLNNKVGFVLTNDTLSIDDFPGNSYDENNGGTHYFIRN